MLLAGQRTQALAAYAETRRAVADRARWHKVAVEDLEKHHVRHAGADPIDEDIIEAVRAMGADLPEPPPPPSRRAAPESGGGV
jgi:hypothetical protein